MILVSSQMYTVQVENGELAEKCMQLNDWSITGGQEQVTFVPDACKYLTITNKSNPLMA